MSELIFGDPRDFIFGRKPNFSDFVDTLYNNLTATDVVLSKEVYLQHVTTSILELAIESINYIKSFKLNYKVKKPKAAPANVAPAKVEKPKAQAKVEKPKATGKCTFVLTRGPNKGAACGKHVHESGIGCSAHDATMKKEQVPADTDSESATTPTKKASKSSKSSSKDSTPKKCVYVMSRGARSGENCGAAVKEGDICNAHLKVKGAKKDVVPSKAITKAKTSDNTEKVVLHKDSERNIIYHKDTGFVFNNDNTIYGRVTLEKSKPVGEVRDLTSEDIEEIRSYVLLNGKLFKIDAKYNAKYNVDEETSDEETSEEEEETSDEADECSQAEED